mgnify:CR=1 FL=1
MILFFRTPSKSVIAVESNHQLTPDESNKLCWLFGEAVTESEENLKGCFVGPRREMITPWSTNAVEITQNMGLEGITRIEEYFPVKDENADHDPMLQRMYHGLDQEIFTVDIKPQPIIYIENLEEYNEKEGLALSREEMDYLMKVEKDLGRKLTDSEVFGFAQINSEHCRHKIFGGTFIIDGQEMESSLFQMIKKTTQENPNKIISAYKDNVAFAKGLAYPSSDHYGRIYTMRSGQPEHIVVTFYNIAPGVERLDRVDVSMGLALNALNIISMRNVPIFWTYSDKAIKNYVQENANKVPAN